MAVFVDNDDVTPWFNAANLTAQAEYTGVILKKTNVTQIEVTFKSGESNILPSFLYPHHAVVRVN